nr:hypothetical protein [Bradyrhizobium sp. CCBAU 21360]
MSASQDCLARLRRMQEARRQIQRQLDLIDRQITRRMTALIPQLKPKRAGYRRGRAPDPSAFLKRYRSLLAAITAERQSEIDALARKLARQDAAIAAYCVRNGLAFDWPDARGPCNRAGLAVRSRSHGDRHHG